jgi:hypothetical protein
MSAPALHSDFHHLPSSPTTGNSLGAAIELRLDLEHRAFGGSERASPVAIFLKEDSFLIAGRLYPFYPRYSDAHIFRLRATPSEGNVRFSVSANLRDGTPQTVNIDMQVEQLASYLSRMQHGASTFRKKETKTAALEFLERARPKIGEIDMVLGWEMRDIRDSISTGFLRKADQPV